MDDSFLDILQSSDDTNNADDDHLEKIIDELMIVHQQSVRGTVVSSSSDGAQELVSQGSNGSRIRSPWAESRLRPRHSSAPNLQLSGDFGFPLLPDFSESNPLLYEADLDPFAEDHARVTAERSPTSQHPKDTRGVKKKRKYNKRKQRPKPPAHLALLRTVGEYARSSTSSGCSQSLPRVHASSTSQAGA